MHPASAPPTDSDTRSLAVCVFDGRDRAERALEAVQASGVPRSRLGLLTPAADGAAEASGLLGQATSTTLLPEVLASLGVAEGEARFYTQEVQSGRSLVVVSAPADSGRIRGLLRQGGGYDVESRGEHLVRGSDPSTPTAGTGAPPPDLTMRWRDVDSRYETLWRQHYGTREASWEEYAPVYRWAWEQANRPEHRGREWTDVAPQLEGAWHSTQGSLPWSQVSGPIRDVWEDVADEARMGAEGGADRRTARPLE